MFGKSGIREKKDMHKLGEENREEGKDFSRIVFGVDFLFCLKFGLA